MYHKVDVVNGFALFVICLSWFAPLLDDLYHRLSIISIIISSISISISSGSSSSSSSSSEMLALAEASCANDTVVPRALWTPQAWNHCLYDDWLYWSTLK